MKTIAIFDVTNAQTCVCMCNGVKVHEQHFDVGENVVEVNLTNAQSTNNLRYYFLGNTDTVYFNNFEIDGLNFHDATGQLYTYHFTSVIPIDADGSKLEDPEYKGHQLNNSGYYRISFTTPVENWFFKTMSYNK